MNRSALAVILLFACAHADADVIIERKSESPKESGVSRVKIKGNRARIDIQGTDGDATIFLDAPAKTVTYMHQSKLALTTTLTDAQLAAKALIKNAGVGPGNQDSLKPTGQTEKVGDWNCEIWARHTPSLSHREWRTKDVPARVMEQMKILPAAEELGVHQTTAAGVFTVKTERSDAKGTSSVTITKISEEAVPEADFTPPQGYREVAAPAK
jgi:hypothetical protein